MITTAGAPGFYRLAGQTILFDPLVPELLPYRLENLPLQAPQIPANILKMRENPPTIQASGWLAEQDQAVCLWQDDCGYLLEIPAAGCFWASADGSSICQLSTSGDADPALLAEAFLGPPLVLALALRGIWCLHASAFEYGHQVITLLGESGAGKSTLAAYLAIQPGVQRVSDDILPVMWEEDKLYALPHFTQLKLPLDQQPGLRCSERLPLAAIYTLEEHPSISIERLGPGSSALLLASHTVAARLFDRQLLSRHFTFCGQAAAIIPIGRLAYPRQFTELPLVWQALKDELDSQHA